MPLETMLPCCPVCGWEHAGPLPGHCGRRHCGVELLPGTPDHLQVGTFALASHYSLCVLPFSFDEIDDVSLRARLLKGGRWIERLFSLRNSADVDRTEYFLPYIRRFLFPSLFSEGKPAEEKPTKQTCWHYEFALTRLGEVETEGLRLILHGQHARRKHALHFPLILEKIELIVFSYKVAFLVLRFRCAESGATFFEQMESLSHLRTLAPLFQGYQIPELEFGAKRFRMTQMLRWLVAEFGTTPAQGSPVDVVEPAVLPVKPIYDDRMMVYTFSCIDRATVLPNAAQCERLIEKHSIVNFDRREITESPFDDNEHESEAWQKKRWQGYSKDGGALVVFNTDRYHERFLGIYHGTYYFDIFLLAALQRVTLLSLFERFSDIHRLITADNASRKLLRGVRRDLLLFKNQCWFSQITNREKGLVLWKKWQKVFANRELVREVNEQSEELDAYLQARYRERIEWLVRLGSFLAGALPLILGLERFLGPEAWVANLRWTLLTLLVIGVAGYAWYMFLRQRDDG
jgi:hypothetical protein